MKRKIIYSLIFVSLFTISCSQIGEPKDGRFIGERSVYFDRENSDTLRFVSFGDRIEDDFTLNIPVKITGTSSSTPLKYRVSVVEEVSTAKVNEQYAPFEGTFEIPANSFDGEVSLLLHRGNLSSDTRESVRLVLELKNSKDLKASFTKKNKIYVDIDNYLSPPPDGYWLDYFWGEYTQKKYIIFLKECDCDSDGFAKKVEALYFYGDYEIIQIGEKVKAYFEAHPEEGQVFP